MTTQFTKLLQPGRIGGMELRNHMVMAPMGTAMAEPDGRYSRRQIEYYAARARGGVGLIITETAKVETKIDAPLAFPMAHAYSDMHVPAMADLTDAVHMHGAKIALQITAGYGRQGSIDPANPPVSASAVPAFGAPEVICRPLEKAEIHAIVKAMGDAATRAVLGGFDAVEIHGHTGYLLDQFLSPVWNKRTDEYGGDLDRRVRFAVEIVEEVRGRVGPHFPILFRLAAVHKFPGGRTVEESIEIAKRLVAAGIDALHLDAGAYDSMDWIFPPYYLGDACLIDDIAAVKQAVNVPVIGVGNMTPETAEEALQAGKADFISFGRSLIADPDLPNKVKRGELDEIRPCIRCNEHCIGRVFTLKSASCAVNPQAGNELFYPLIKVEEPKRVVVIGGGPAGMEAARVAASRGHQVTLFEREPEVGGTLLVAATPPFKYQLRRTVDWWERQLKNLGVDVRLGTAVDARTPEVEAADVVLVATGAKPIWPQLPGIEGKNVVEVHDYHLHPERVTGERVIVAGGGLSGCDAALEMALQGKKVTVVEMLDTVAADLNVITRISLMRELAERGVTLLTGRKVKAFLPDGVMVESAGGQQEKVEGDSVVVAFGVRRDPSVVEALGDLPGEVRAFGDCVKPGKVADAVRAAFFAAYEL